MNKRGSFGLAIIYALVIFIIGMATVNLITPEIDNARDATTGLGCTNSSISDGTKLTCLAVDSVVPYWFILIISIAGGLILERLTI